MVLRVVRIVIGLPRSFFSGAVGCTGCLSCHSRLLQCAVAPPDEITLAAFGDFNDAPDENLASFLRAVPGSKDAPAQRVPSGIAGFNDADCGFGMESDERCDVRHAGAPLQQAGVQSVSQSPAPGSESRR